MTPEKEPTTMVRRGQLRRFFVLASSNKSHDLAGQNLSHGLPLVFNLRNLC